MVCELFAAVIPDVIVYVGGVVGVREGKAHNAAAVRPPWASARMGGCRDDGGRKYARSG